MSSTVKVVGTDLRQVVVKVQPGTYLTDVLEEAARKLKVSPDRFLLKYKQKQLDLSNTFRTSGLIPGAKLELVVKAKTPSVLTVALQLPEPQPGRLTEKLASDTTLWKVLRFFESSDEGQKKALNITARGAPGVTSGTASGSGQLYYEQPVLQLESRQLTSFVDFQKSLSQFGYNSGNVLIRLSFQKTNKTFADAMQEMAQYFKEEEEVGKERDEAAARQAEVAPPPAAVTQETNTENAAQADMSESAAPGSIQAEETSKLEAADAMDIDEPAQPADPFQPTSIYAAPSSTTLAAALIAESDDVFVPTNAHAQAHQKLLEKAGQNKRLLSDKEIADKAAQEEARISKIKMLAIRVRFPDNTSAEWNLKADTTGEQLYEAVRTVMAHNDAAFRLVLPHPQKRELSNDSKTLVQGLGLQGSTIVFVHWDDSVPAAVRKQPFMKQSAASRAQEPVAPKLREQPDVEEKAPAPSTSSAPTAPQGGSGSGGSGMKVPKWFKGLGKK